MELKPLNNIKDAEKIIAFMYSDKAFHWPLSPGEKKAIKQRIMSALDKNKLTRYWFYEDKNGNIIAAGGIDKLRDTENGYFLGWFAVHKDYRRKGLGRKIIERVEKYAKSIKGRFIIIDTGEDNQAQIFYEKVGYKKVGFIPEYFEDKAGMVGKVLLQKIMSYEMQLLN